MEVALFFFAGLALLYVGGEALVRAAAALGQRMHMSPLVAGLTIVAFATSAPELAISLGAAINDLPGLAIGNVVGSNICNLGLILGIVAIIKPAPVRRTLVRLDVLVMSAATLVVPVMLIDGGVSRFEGLFLLASILLYITWTVFNARVTRHERHADEHTVPTLSDNVVLNSLVAATGIVMLVLGSQLFVDSSVTIAEFIGVPAAVVGLSAAALGSSLPELSASIVAARHGQPEMAAGNLIGSNIFNLLLILGMTAAFRPLVSRAVTGIDLGMMIGISALALLFMLTRAHLHRREGLVLVGIYLGYMVWLFVSQRAV